MVNLTKYEKGAYIAYIKVSFYSMQEYYQHMEKNEQPQSLAIVCIMFLFFIF
jgi:hypothetical protein